MARVFSEFDERFKFGLTMFYEGAQWFYGNLRLLLDVRLVQEDMDGFFDLVESLDLIWEFCVRSGASFVMVDTKRQLSLRDPVRGSWLRESS